MTLAFPIWLTALLPWAGVAIYLLLGKRPRADVPFINLWRGPVTAPRTSPSIQRLPLWIGLLLAAAGLAIFAAAGPRWRETSPANAAMPASKFPTIGIELVAFAHDQIMVRVLNESTATQASLTITLAGSTKLMPLDLPPRGESRNYYFAVPGSVDGVTAMLTDSDPSQPGHSIELRRRQSWPTMKTLSPLPEALQRMTDVYAARRPASAQSSSVGIVTGDAAKLDGGAGVVIADAVQSSSGMPQVITHLVTQGVDWPTALADAKVAAASPSGWTPLVTVGDHMIVGVREQPTRQVWIGFDSPAFARTPEFVVFWTNVFNWVGQGGEEFQPVPGTVFASVQPSIAQIAEPQSRDLSPWLACVAVALSAVAMAAVPRRFP